MLEIRVSTQEEQDAVVAAMHEGRLGELLDERGFNVRTERDGHLRTVAGHGRNTSNTSTFWSGSGSVAYGGGGPGGTNTTATPEPPG